MQYGGAFFAEFRLIARIRASAKHRPPGPGRFALRFCRGSCGSVFVLPGARARASPAFQEGDDALKQGAPEFRPVEQQRHNLGAGFRVASGERVEQDQCRAGRQIRQ